MASLVLTNITNQECVICADTYTSHKRKKIGCGFCSFECCIECVKTYLLTQTALPHCMSCKNQWDDAECDDKLGNFMHGKYRIHRKFMLFEGERAKIPETMTAVENYLNVNKWSEKVREKDKEIEILSVQMSKLRKARHKLITEIEIVKKGGDIKEKDKKVFIRACPQNDCNGFLSSQWKCAVCKINVCSECYEIKEEEEHACDENILATAKVLKKDSKACPGCSAMIFKISGCDQMWCTQCHIAFSWKSGKRVNGVVHNPHYYQWARENGGAVRQPGAAGPCGGLPAFHYYIGKIRNYNNTYSEFLRQSKFFSEMDRRNNSSNFIEWNRFTEMLWNEHYLQMILTYLLDRVFILHESVTHFIHHEINRLREACQRQVDNKLLRIQYITKEKDEKTIKTTLLRRDNLFKKKNAMLQIYELAGQVFTESIVSTTQNPCASNIYEQIIKCEKLRQYCNKELVKVSKIYKQSVKYIQMNGRANTVPESTIKEITGFREFPKNDIQLLDSPQILKEINDGTFEKTLEKNKFYKDWRRIYGRYRRHGYHRY
jgi:hypothetical protein